MRTVVTPPKAKPKTAKVRSWKRDAQNLGLPI